MEGCANIVHARYYAIRRDICRNSNLIENSFNFPRVITAISFLKYYLSFELILHASQTKVAVPVLLQGDCKLVFLRICSSRGCQFNGLPTRHLSKLWYILQLQSSRHLNNNYVIPIALFFNKQLCTLSKASPGASSRLSPSNKKSLTALAMASRQWPPLISKTKKGNLRAWLCILAVKACASMWCIGMNGLEYFLHKCLPYLVPISRDRGRPGLTVVAIASTSSTDSLAAFRASSTTFSMFWRCKFCATGGIIPPFLQSFESNYWRD